MPSESRPVLNPVLAFKRDPRRTIAPGRSQGEPAVRADRLAAQRIALAAQLRQIRASAPIAHNDQVLVAVRMFGDSLAPTHEPKALFRASLNSELVAPLRNGYLAQIRLTAFEELATLIGNGTRIDVRIAVSRIESIAALSASDILGGRDAHSLWSAAVEGEAGRIFTAWLAPYADVAARESVVTSLQSMETQAVLGPLSNVVVITREPGSDADQLQLQLGRNGNSVARAAREYRQNAFSRLQFSASEPDTLQRLVASGTVYRIDPVRPLQAAEVPSAPDPERPVPDQTWQPVVGVIDGGLFAQSYAPMVAWRAPTLVADVVANRSHGNRIGSLVVHGGAWNTHLDIPDLTCRIGVAQAIARNGEGGAYRPAILSYIRSVIARHSGDTKVWNFSFSEPVRADDPLDMSEMGHEIHKVAREFGILPVIAIGNIDPNNSSRMTPPGDCEAALTVGGRVADGAKPGEACLVCLPGPGPDGAKKPELTWFSTLRALGGSVDTGSSYATAITSALAAHTFRNLKAPTPDLVRALLINTADRDEYSSRLGWGSPCQRTSLPWECADNSVTLIWTGSVRAGQWHYWEDIPIPPELVHDGKLRGRVALTAILNPMVSELGSANYFSTRVQVALQYTQVNGKMGNLAGSMREDVESEDLARAELSKWNPVRHHVATIPNGRSFSGTTLRVCARVFARDLYQFGLANNGEIPPGQVAFVLTLSAPESASRNSSIYNSVAARLGTYVESAVNDIEVAVEQ
ncbi:S8 family peptidase [Robbsia andropogonis]|uniref:S8 family peptidase n=1 Tax=Robbsia andropogonis TaxID=28092 RepID=UPI00046563C4|nr:S8 family peptidase [Robbsia andropogonis]